MSAMSSQSVVRPIKRARRRNWTNIIRRGSQLAFALFIIVASLRHHLAGETAALASIDSLCPLGGLETLWTWLSTGRFVSKTHPSNLVLGLGLVIGVLLAGNAFCGWICPFGAFQDALHWVRRKLRLPAVRVPDRADAILRYGRFVVLGVVLYATITSTKLWFAEYDPYRTLFGLNWALEFNWSEMWPALLILAVVTAASLLVERAFCKYLCPLGGALSLLQNFSLLRIRRTDDACKGCALCERPCPVGIKVATAAPAMSANCIGCLNCVESCPKHGALTLQFGPRWLDPILRRFGRGQKPQPGMVPVNSITVK